MLSLSILIAKEGKMKRFFAFILSIFSLVVISSCDGDPTNSISYERITAEQAKAYGLIDEVIVSH